MNYELIAGVKKIDLALMEYFEKDKEVDSIISFGDMAFLDYKSKKNNLYKVLIVKEKDEPDDFFNLIDFMNNLGRRIPFNSYRLISTNFETEKELKEREYSNNLELEVQIYTKEELENFLSPTLRHNFAKRYRLIYGMDTLKEYQSDNLLFLDLKKDIDNFLMLLDNTSLKEEEFFLLSDFLQNIFNHCKLNNYDIPSDKILFFIRLLNPKFCTNDILFILQGLLTKRYDIITSIFPNPEKEIKNLFLRLKESLLELDVIFSKELKSKELKLTP